MSLRYVGPGCKGNTRRAEIAQRANLVDVPGDGIYLVPREVACLMQRIKKECAPSVRVYAETGKRQLVIDDVATRRSVLLVFESIEADGLVPTLDRVCSLLAESSDVVYSIEVRETEVSETGEVLAEKRRRIIVKRKGAGYERSEE